MPNVSRRHTVRIQQRNLRQAGGTAPNATFVHLLDPRRERRVERLADRNL